MTSYHLGIYMGHDTGAAIVDDDLNIIHVFEEERFDGEKMTYYNPYFSLKHIIELGIRYFKTVSFGFNPDERQAKFHKEFVKFQNVRCAEVLNYLSHHITWDKVCYVDHHTCHAASAFYPSGFRNAAIFVADGSGESEATSFYLGEGNSISRVSSELTTDFSLGILYQYFTEWLGYRSGNTSQHCGKIMGLSSYGRPIYKERIRSMLDIKGDSVIWPEGSLVKMWRGIVAEFGVPQQRPTRHYTRLQADVAASLQQLLEELVIEKLERISGNGRFGNLCLAGGVAMNSLLNYRILRSGICENLFVQPLASDRGIALGAALESAAKAVDAHKNAVRAPLWNTYFGYEEKPLQTSLDKLLDKYNLPVYIDKAEISAKEIARLLDENQILALFQGRQEIGPRALGNRSIIAAPTIESRDKTNGQVKYREAWRPFAPTVLEEEVGNYFDINRPEPFMTVIYGVLPQKTGGIEGITHVDGTARLQTIRVDQNPLYYSIIKE